MADHDRLHPLRPLLKNWVWEHGRIGTRYLDCIDGEIKFDEGKKSHFAAEKYIGLTQKATPERGNELLRSDVNPKRSQGS